MSPVILLTSLKGLLKAYLHNITATTLLTLIKKAGGFSSPHPVEYNPTLLIEFELLPKYKWL
jgi:hypothetical protein